MREPGRRLRTSKALLYGLIVVLSLPYFLAVIFEAPSSGRFLALVFLALGASILIRAYRAEGNP
jgi:hypothetical protein